MGKSSSHKFLEFFVDKKFYKETWYFYLTGEWHEPFPDELKSHRAFFDFQYKVNWIFPSEAHCHECGKPMTGFWGNAFGPMGSAPSSFSPKLCSACEKSARQYEVGAEVELTMIFADVRDSTPLAESLIAETFARVDEVMRRIEEGAEVASHERARITRLNPNIRKEEPI